MSRNIAAGATEYTCTVSETRLVTVTYERKVLAYSERAAYLIMNNDMAQLWADIEDSSKGNIIIGAVQETT